MATKAPRSWSLTTDEAYRVIRIRVAKYIGGIEPRQVDEWPQSDVDDVLGMIWAEEQLSRKE